jgi:hypothetical protein
LQPPEFSQVFGDFLLENPLGSDTFVAGAAYTWCLFLLATNSDEQGSTYILSRPLTFGSSAFHILFTSHPLIPDTAEFTRRSEKLWRGLKPLPWFATSLALLDMMVDEADFRGWVNFI